MHCAPHSSRTNRMTSSLTHHCQHQLSVDHKPVTSLHYVWYCFSKQTHLFGGIEGADSVLSPCLHFEVKLFNDCKEFCLRWIMSPGLILMSLSLLSSTRCRMLRLYAIFSKHCSYDCMFGIPRWVSAWSMNWRSFKGVFVTSECTVKDSEAVVSWVGVVGSIRWGNYVWAIEAKLERICEKDANIDWSDKGMWLGHGIHRDAE